MIATAITGDDFSIIIAFGIAPVKKFEYWKFFIAALNSSFNLNNYNNLVILTDREKGLLLAISELIPNAFHSYCVYHIEKNIKNRFKTNTNGHIWKAAKTLARNDFYKHMNNLKDDKGMEMFNYLSSILLKTWASAYFPVQRFGHVTSNIVESINSAIGDDIRKKAPLFILVEITRKIAQTIVQRKNEKFLATSNFNNIITKKLKAKLQANISIARALKTIPTSDPCIYKVQDQRISSIYRIVDISSKSCTCKKTVEFGFPCEHIYAVIVGTAIDEKNYIIKSRKINTPRKLYTGVMKPVNITTFSSESDLKYIQMNRKGKRRRNESARIPSLAETIQRKTYSCRSCNGTNHNAQTCPSQRN